MTPIQNVEPVFSFLLITPKAKMANSPDFSETLQKNNIKLFQHVNARMSACIGVHTSPLQDYIYRRKHQDRRKNSGCPFETARPDGNHADIAVNTLASAATR